MTDCQRRMQENTRYARVAMDERYDKVPLKANAYRYSRIYTAKTNIQLILEDIITSNPGTPKQSVLYRFREADSNRQIVIDEELVSLFFICVNGNAYIPV